MLKKIARIVNLVLWILILITFAFNDYFGISVYCDGERRLGPYHILAILFGVVGLAAAVIGMLEMKDAEGENSE
jgi:hypothetical protein